jgi:hypothetical protein
MGLTTILQRRTVKALARHTVSGFLCVQDLELSPQFLNLDPLVVFFKGGQHVLGKETVDVVDLPSSDEEGDATWEPTADRCQMHGLPEPFCRLHRVEQVAVPGHDDRLVILAGSSPDGHVHGQLHVDPFLLAGAGEVALVEGDFLYHLGAIEETFLGANGQEPAPRLVRVDPHVRTVEVDFVHGQVPLNKLQQRAKVEVLPGPEEIGQSAVEVGAVNVEDASGNGEELLIRFHHTPTVSYCPAS